MFVLQVLYMLIGRIGTDPLIHALTARLASDMSITLASLHTMRIDPVLRLRAAELVLPAKDTKVNCGIILLNTTNLILN
jgi:hypothetical protein